MRRALAGAKGAADVLGSWFWEGPAAGVGCLLEEGDGSIQSQNREGKLAGLFTG